MTDQDQTFPPDLSGQSRTDWLLSLRTLGEARGFAEALGPAHAAIFVEEGDTLLVTFETMPGIETLSPRRTPLGFDFVADQGWSSLALLAASDTWFRDPKVIAFFDNLQEDGFFRDFERVIFYGAGPCGYAAAAFSAACPDARVLVIQPQATLAPRIAGWDPRFVDHRKRDFSGRYGYAPDSLATAHSAHLLFDPREPYDAMHAALFHAQAQSHPLPFMGDALQSALIEMKVLAPMLQAVAQDRLTPALLARMARLRRTHPPYLRRLLAQLDRDDRDRLAMALCRNVTSRMNAPRFRRRLADLEAAHKGDGTDA